MIVFDPAKFMTKSNCQLHFKTSDHIKFLH